jgi:hypothetical protein
MSQSALPLTSNGAQLLHADSVGVSSSGPSASAATSALSPVGAVAPTAVEFYGSTVDFLALSPAQLECVRTIHIDGSDKGDLQNFTNALQKCTKLISLRIVAEGIDDVCGIALTEAIKQNNSLTGMNLRSNTVADAGARALAEAIKQIKAITSVNLEQPRRCKCYCIGQGPFSRAEQSSTCILVATTLVLQAAVLLVWQSCRVKASSPSLWANRGSLPQN